jgi:hypothetical protein
MKLRMQEIARAAAAVQHDGHPASAVAAPAAKS